MHIYDYILHKLNLFIRKHYTQKLVKGVLLFLALGLLFFLIVMAVEYMLWLNSTGRLVLLMVFVAVELFLLSTYILKPLFYLFKLKNGIGPKDAAQIIGRHFPNVGDKLYNLLDLAENKEESELLLASIAQRSQQLRPVPFTNAINYKDALGNAKYMIIPIVIVGLLWVSGNWNTFFGSYERVVNYNLAYEPPAPFQFKLLSGDLNAIESKPFEIRVATQGEIKPENVYMIMGGREILLQYKNGIYQYTLSPPLVTANFSFIANDVQSRQYKLNALKAPSIIDFSLELNYPSYLKKRRETLKGTGNAILPEGTKVSWNILGQNTADIRLITKDTAVLFTKDADSFALSKHIYQDLRYQLSTSNANVQDYEKLDYGFKIIKDGHPKIKVVQVLDSLNPNISYYSGEASDDYGLSQIDLIYYELGKEKEKKSIKIDVPKNGFAQFYYTYPSGLDLETGKNYAFYFLVTDNDAIHHGKTAKSQVFNQVLLDDGQLKNRDLESQQSLINNLDRSLEKAKEQREVLEEISQQQKEKNSLNFNDQKQIKDFLKKQERQEELMQKFSKELKENLNKSDTDDKLNRLLQERLERQELEAKKNQKLLEELNKIADKINKEELSKRLEELGKKQQNGKRSLEQLLELTKRYYVTEKAAQLARDLEKLSERQEVLSDLKIGKDFSEKEQKKMNESFEKLSEELEELRKENSHLKKPINLKIDEDKKSGVKEDQEHALEEIRKHHGTEQSSQKGGKMENSGSKAARSQKSAAQKMKEMSKELSQSSAGGGGGSSIAEDAEMLRQILDNLVIFSFKQESLFDKLSNREEEDVIQYSTTVRDQKELKNLFEHVDDSLFALSLRQAELSEFVNEQITEVYYNIDKSLESIADGKTYQGVSYQKYVLTASNNLADFLAEVMDNMQQSMQMGKGQGKGEGFQLPDIIRGQGEVNEKMGESGKSGSKGNSGKKQGDGQEGQKGGEESKGKQGENGKSGKEGPGNGKEQGQGGDGKNGKGNSGGSGNDGKGQGQMSESELQEIYEIYQQQQRIRQELEKQLKDMINADDRKLGERLVRQMEDFENDLLENGITQRTINKANTIQYELLKLENATLKQGEKPERESTTNTRNFTNPITTKPSLLDNYHNEVEILNRHALPLRQNFQNKVKEYFKEND
ncbi:hypothetical protein [Maribacter sp. 2304DJ31-5]|uniref:hypothetical protein n=1 Tax=Maribacter sp. 2304DJ31-5 TaxID=3386273 RepID=UPI0039BD3B51